VKVMNSVELRRKDELYRMWYKYMQMQREKALENTQNAIVSDLADQVASIGQLSDYAEEQNQTNKSLTDKHRLTCQKILALSFKRCHHMAQ
jgi:hypothetical protein